jgi:hypothetical protein
MLAAASLAVHLGEFRDVNASLGAGVVGALLLLLAQLAYVPNAIAWAISFTLGPGFAFGAGTVVAPTGSTLGQLPAFPLLAALPQGVHSAVAPLSVAVLAVPYLAGAFGGLVTVRAAPVLALETAPLWGFACGALTGGVLGVIAAFAGGPLGNGRLAAVGPSAWQVGLVAALEVGVAAAVTSGVANWLRQRAAAVAPAAEPGAAGNEALQAFGFTRIPDQDADHEPDDDGHRIYLDPWAGTADPDDSEVPPPTPRSPFTGPLTPASLPRTAPRRSLDHPGSRPGG